MNTVPIKALLLTGGGPFHSSRPSWVTKPGTSIFLHIDTLDELPPFEEISSKAYQVCVMPTAMYLTGVALPVELITIVYGSIEDAVSCLEAGAFDFMPENWSLGELEARLFRYWRLELRGNRGSYYLWGCSLVPLHRAVEVSGSETLVKAGTVELTPGQAAIMRLLLTHPGKVISFSALGQAGGLGLSGHCAESRDSALREYSKKAAHMMMSRIKARLSSLDPGLAARISSVRGQGYLWRDGF